MRNFSFLKRWDGLGCDVTRYVAKAEVKLVWYWLGETLLVGWEKLYSVIGRNFTYWLGETLLIGCDRDFID